MFLSRALTWSFTLTRRNSHHKPGDIHVAATAPKEAKEDISETKTSVEVMEPKTMKDAMANAKKITEEKGISSPDARIAWELVEELAATEAHHRTTGQG